MPLSFYAVGFSKSGDFGWVERRSGFDSDELDWTLYVQDLVRDRVVTATTDPTSVELRRGRRDEEGYRTPYDVVLHGRSGEKRLGTVWRVERESGEDPVDAPKLLGILRSPFEPRIAVLVTQETIGTEGVQIILVKVFGARLDKGWLKK